MTNQAMARDLLAALCFLQGLATLVIDLNRTHATHPQWLGHARFHLVWQAMAFALLAVLEVILILAGGPLRDQRFYLAAVLASIPMLGFFAALTGRSVYKGTLSDPNGIPPMTITIPGSDRRIDLNLVAECGGVLALAVIILLYRH